MSVLPALLDSLIDYAGLFPPAKLTMAEAVRNYASYLHGPHARCLGRFVLPVTRLDEFDAELAKLRATEQPPWQLSAFAGPNPAADAASVQAFNLRQERARIVAIETKATTPAEVTRAVQTYPPGIEIWIELPAGDNTAASIGAIPPGRAGAKIRTGGVTPDAFPSARAVLRFFVACREANLPFKATAGLHHPLRGEFPLTYEPDAAHGVMFGFLNVFLAAALIHAGGNEVDAFGLLEERDATAFALSSDTIAWRRHRFTAAHLAGARKNFCRSFGSCSFTEPIDGLRQLSWL